MKICTNCFCRDDVCGCGDNANLVDAGNCENCGTIEEVDTLAERDGFCDECEDARIEYVDSVVLLILDNIDDLVLGDK